jgi:hypothetical protein
MPSVTFEYRSEAERAAIERAVAFVAEMHSLAQSAPADRVIDACEGLALGRGRDALRDAVRSAVQGRIDAAEQKGGPPAAAPAPPRAPRA